MILPPRFDPLDPAVLDDPYPTYARLRAAGPVCRGGPAQWVVTRYADISGLIGDGRLASEYDPDYHRIAVGEGPLAEFFGRIVLNRDPPAHTRLRRLLGQAFTPALVRGHAPRIAAIADELLAPARATGRLEAVADVAQQLPIRVLGELIGLDPAALAQVRPRALELSRAFATHLPGEQRPAAHEALVWLRAHVSGLLDTRRAAPGGDLLSRLLAAQDGDDVLTAEEIIDNVVFLLFAGFATTTDLLATGCAELAGRPAVAARLRAEPDLVPSAVEELLRWDAPVQVKTRVAREALEIGDRTIRPGRIVVLLLGSANHDPDRFAEPDRLDVARRPNPHLSFGGGGIHHCLGAALARLEATVFFDRLLRGFASVEAGGPLVRRPSASFRSFAEVPLTLVPLDDN
jgi:cytochrome P450